MLQLGMVDEGLICRSKTHQNLSLPKNIWSKITSLIVTAGLLATIDERFPSELYESIYSNIPLDRRGAETAIITISGTGIEWPQINDLLPASIFDDSVEKIAVGLGVSPQDLSGNVYTLAPISEPDTAYKYGNSYTYDRTSKTDFAIKLATLRDRVLSQHEYGRVIILSMTHGGVERHWFDDKGMRYEDFTRYLASYKNFPILYISEECYAGAALSPWEGVAYDQIGNANAVSNSVETALLANSPNLTYIAVA